jgi:hypothetical protein
MKSAAHISLNDAFSHAIHVKWCLRSLTCQVDILTLAGSAVLGITQN